MTATLHTSFSDAVEQTTQALASQGFGVLTKIDVKATLKQKLGKDMEEYLILGACNPQLAHRALDVDRHIGQLLPCNVVLRTAEDGGVLVEAMDPQLMVRVVEQPGLQEIADEAAAKLQAAISALSQNS